MSRARGPECAPSTALSNRFLFTGREWIGEIGIYDYRNRVYSPDLGRFLQTDPIRFDARDVNLYRYVGNNAVNWVDFFGLSPNGTHDYDAWTEAPNCPPPEFCPETEPLGDSKWKRQKGFWGAVSEQVFHKGLRCYRENVPTDSRQCCYNQNGNLVEGDIDDNNPEHKFWDHVNDVLNPFQ